VLQNADIFTCYQHDSGQEPPVPVTREHAAEYITERRAAHEQFHRGRKRRDAYAVKRGEDGLYTWEFRSDKDQIIARFASGYATEAEVEAG
jgi:predicted DNA-binding transcriptional regulator YafY